MAADGIAAATAPHARPPVAAIAAGTERFTQARIERILAMVVALGCGVLGAQALLNAIGSVQEARPWHVALMTAAFLPIAAMIAVLLVAPNARIVVRATSGTCAVVLVLVFAAWPAATAGIAADPSTEPWIWYLLNVATTAAVVAFRLPMQVVWAVLVPAVYAVARLAQIGTGRAEAIAVTLDAAFAVILAGVIIALGWMLRTVAAVIDRARTDAIASYADAADAEAAETERVAVAALMHDSVLAALIAAERAMSPREEALAVAMSREALTRLANAEQDAGEGSDEPVSAASLVDGLERAFASLGTAVAVAATIDPAAPTLPGRVARAIVLAATQAAANAIEHADGQGLAVAMAATPAGIEVRVADSGPGFDPGEVAPDRLGIRGSIVARMAAAGGRARVQTTRAGTTILLEWEPVR